MVREMGAVSIVVHVNALTSRLVDATGLGSSAFSPAGTDNGPHAVSCSSGGEISSSFIVCAGGNGSAYGLTGCGRASNKKPTQKKVPMMTAPTTPKETTWGTA